MSEGSLAKRRIGVLGLARSGEAAARLALARGAAVYASDLGRGEAVREAAERIRALGGDAEAGAHDVEKLAACDEVVLSPGIPPSAPVLGALASAGVPVVSEIDFASALLDCPIIAITGTNGKTTTTAMIAHLLQTAGWDAPAGGNIGTALSELALRSPAPRVAVVEVSSFQLGASRSFAPAIGVVTNLAPDHLDWYADVEQYYADKARLFQNAAPESRWILNGEDARVRALASDAAGERYYFRAASALAPRERGGWLADDGWLTLRLEAGREERLLRADQLRVLGPHNVANALAAALAARLAGADLAPIRAALGTFGALPHRLQPVGERGGVLWIDDSKATNVASAQVALRSMQRPTILLLGGRHKGEPYTTLLDGLAAGRVRHVVAFGEAREHIVADLGSLVEVERVEGTFDEAVRRAAALAQPGDVVLLSPACSSYDMFTDYEARGRRFAELVERL